jgi:RecA-family ATPase
MPELLQAALRCIERGWHVFPVHPADKTPLTENGLYDATLDDAQVREWWSMWPGAMVAVRTGPESGIWVLDLDTKNGVNGATAFAQLADGKESIPETIKVRSPSGGVHLYFRWVDGIKNSASKLAPGIDTRGQNGYIIAAGVCSDGRSYEPLADTWPQPPTAPQWLIDLVTSEPQPLVTEEPQPKTKTEPHNPLGNGSAYARAALENECVAVAGAPEGKRNNTLNTASFNLHQLVAGGELSESEVHDRLADAATAAGLGRNEIEGTIESGRKAGSAKPRSAPPQEQKTGQPKTEAPPLHFIIPSKVWPDKPVPPREWSTLNRFPLRQVALLSGEGAIGKSISLMQLCAAHAFAKDLLSAMPEQGPAIYLGAEDETDELHRRMADIAAHYGAQMSELKDLHLLSLAGKDAILSYADRNNMVQVTPLFARLKEAAYDIKPKLIGLDTASDLFSGNESDRSQVRQFIGHLRDLAIASNSTVLVCSHPSLTGINTGSGLSGSTAWHNSVRARAYLHTATTDDGDTPDPELRQLDFMKNQYGPVAERVLLRWKNGVFVPEPRAGSLETLAKEQKADEVFLNLLTRLNARGETLSPKRTAHMFAPSVFTREPEAKTAHLTKKNLTTSMTRLIDTNKIHLAQYGSPSRETKKLVPGPKP